MLKIYVCEDIEVQRDKMQQVIENIVLMEDLEYDQMSLNEYIDPFTGEPVQKGK